MRTVVEEVDVSAVVDSVSNLYGRAGDAWNALKWRLTRGPEEGVAIPLNPSELEHFVMKLPQEADVPSVSAVYRYTADSVTIVGVRFQDENGETIGSTS